LLKKDMETENHPSEDWRLKIIHLNSYEKEPRFVRETKMKYII